MWFGDPITFTLQVTILTDCTIYEGELISPAARKQLYSLEHQLVFALLKTFLYICYKTDLKIDNQATLLHCYQKLYM